ncbi:cytochrome oxidase small assembly protein [Variovorax beijingensis]|nr:cytochrome oxidase small assembly protein [Variovorax beijingensis]
MTTPEQKRNNRRMGLTLASIAVLFFIGFLVRMIWLGGR